MAGPDGTPDAGTDDPSEPYSTVAGRGEAAFEVGGSAFVGRVARADSVQSAEAFLKAVAADALLDRVLSATGGRARVVGP